ncbi:hypothetical protein ACJJTC_016612 [Scirpophaga incertulas]
MASSSYNLPAQLSLSGNLSENWRKFSQAFAIYIEASGLTVASESRKIAILLNLIGEEALTVYNTFEFDEKSHNLKHVLEKFQEYCNPKKNILHSRFKFYSRKQNEAEQFEHFLTDVKMLANDCQFESCKENMIRDRLVFGTRDTDTQLKLIKNGDPHLEEVINMLRLSSLNEEQIKDIKNEVNSVTSQKQKSITKSRNERDESITKVCSKCGYIHNYRQCPAFNKTCAKCQAKNHFAKMCRTNINKNINEIKIDSEPNYCCGSIVSPIFKTYSLGWYQDLFVQNEKIKFKLDPGSDVNIIPIKLYKKILEQSKLPIQLNKTTAELESWNGFKTKIEGTVMLTVKLNDKEYQEMFCIAGGDLSVPILSRDSCVKLNLVKRVESCENKLNYNKDYIIANNKDLFTGIDDNGVIKTRNTKFIKRNNEEVESHCSLKNNQFPQNYWSNNCRIHIDENNPNTSEQLLSDLEVAPRRSNRETRPPHYLSDYVCE